MPEPISIALLSLGFGYAALYGYERSNTAISIDAQSTKDAVAKLLESNERSLSLFGRKASAISVLRELVAECAEDDWDGYDARPLDPLALRNAEEFIRATINKKAAAKLSANQRAYRRHFSYRQPTVPIA